MMWIKACFWILHENKFDVKKNYDDPVFFFRTI